MTPSPTPGTAEWFAAELTRVRLVEPSRLDPLVDEFLLAQPDREARQLAGFLVLRRVLSRFQAEKALVGEVDSLILGPYVVVEPLGGGALGGVFRAIARADQQLYAVKVLPARGRWDLRQAGRQVREFATVPAHPTVVPCLDVGVAQGRHYLVWPIVEGETLDRMIERRGPLPPVDAVRLCRRLAQGLHTCHVRGLFHGQIKPSNVQISPDGTPRLLDFGIGAVLAENTDESLLGVLSAAGPDVGTFDCASPESILDPASRSPAGDQYGLGCLLFFALTGRGPFPDGSLVDRMVAHQLQPAPLDRLPSTVPADLVAVIARLMAKRPDERFANLDELMQELERPAGGSLLEVRGLALQDTPPSGLMDNTATQLPRPSGSPAGLGPRPGLRGSGQGTTLRPTLAPSTQANPARTAPPESEPESPAARGLLGRVVSKLSFWRPDGDSLAVSILAPPRLPPGEAVTLAVFAHAADTTDVAALGRTYFPQHRPVVTAPLRRDVIRGTRLTFHLALPGITVDSAVQKFVWRGQTMPLPYTVRVPRDYRPGEIVGVVSVAEGGDVIIDVDFHIMVGRT